MSMAAGVISSLQRVHRQMRVLDQAYMDAESKPHVQTAVEAKFHELQALHDLLPTDLRDKSWILQLQGYGPRGTIRS